MGALDLSKRRHASGRTGGTRPSRPRRAISPPCFSRSRRMRSRSGGTLDHLSSRGPRQVQLDGLDLHAGAWVPPPIAPASNNSAATASAPRSPRTASSSGPTSASSSSSRRSGAIALRISSSSPSNCRRSPLRSRPARPSSWRRAISYSLLALGLLEVGRARRLAVLPENRRDLLVADPVGARQDRRSRRTGARLSVSPSTSCGFSVAWQSLKSRYVVANRVRPS